MPATAERVVAEAVAALGGLDCAVLNAGISHSGSVLEQTPESFERVLRTNTIAPFLVARAALPHVIERKGSLIAVSSAAALTAGPHSAAYSTSKAAVSMLMKTIAIDFADTGIRSNSVCPAWVRTDMGDAMMDELGEQQGIDREAAYTWANRFIPAKRPATLDEVAGTVLFLAGARRRLHQRRGDPDRRRRQLRQRRPAVGRVMTTIEHFIDGERVGSPAHLRGPLADRLVADRRRRPRRPRDRRPRRVGRGARVPGVGRARARPGAPSTCAGWPTWSTRTSTRWPRPSAATWRCCCAR